MTARERVLAKYPDARAEQYGGRKSPWCIIARVRALLEFIGNGDTEDAAWEDAAARIEGGEKITSGVTQPCSNRYGENENCQCHICRTLREHRQRFPNCAVVRSATPEDSLPQPANQGRDDIGHALWYRGGRLYSELKDALVLHPEIWSSVEGVQRMLAQWDEIARRFASEILLASRPESVAAPDIERMTQRFLGWPLPENFNPDDGITFSPIVNAGTAHEYKRHPTGTNLLDYDQAKAMIQYIVSGPKEPTMPKTPAVPTVNYVSEPRPDDAEYTEQCAVCGAACKPGEPCNSCESVERKEPQPAGKVEIEHAHTHNVPGIPGALPCAACDIEDLLAEKAALEQRLEQATVQLAGCLTAAEGPGTIAERTAWGWSPAYQAVVDLRLQHDALRENVGKAVKLLDNVIWDGPEDKKLLREALALLGGEE